MDETANQSEASHAPHVITSATYASGHFTASKAGSESRVDWVADQLDVFVCLPVLKCPACPAL